MPTSLRDISLAYRVNSETLNSDRNLSNGDFEIQNYTTQVRADLNVFLPTNPSTHRTFVIINQATSFGNLIIDGITISPGDRHEIIFDGIQWIIL